MACIMVHFCILFAHWFECISQVFGLVFRFFFFCVLISTNFHNFNIQVNALVSVTSCQSWVCLHSRRYYQFRRAIVCKPQSSLKSLNDGFEESLEDIQRTFSPRFISRYWNLSLHLTLSIQFLRQLNNRHPTIPILLQDIRQQKVCILSTITS